MLPRRSRASPPAASAPQASRSFLTPCHLPRSTPPSGPALVPASCLSPAHRFKPTSIDEAGERIGILLGEFGSHRLALPPGGHGLKWNLFDVRPLFHLTPRPPRRLRSLRTLSQSPSPKAKAHKLCNAGAVGVRYSRSVQAVVRDVASSGVPTRPARLRQRYAHGAGSVAA